jgi:hypothetical protein
LANNEFLEEDEKARRVVVRFIIACCNHFVLPLLSLVIYERIISRGKVGFLTLID